MIINRATPTPSATTGILAGLLGAAVIATATATPPLDLSPSGPVAVYVTPQCQPHLIGDDITDGMVAPLLSQGWTSDPTDGIEALYAPACHR